MQSHDDRGARTLTVVEAVDLKLLLCQTWDSNSSYFSRKNVTYFSTIYKVDGNLTFLLNLKRKIVPYLMSVYSVIGSFIKAFAEIVCFSNNNSSGNGKLDL